MSPNTCRTWPGSVSRSTNAACSPASTHASFSTGPPSASPHTAPAASVRASTECPPSVSSCFTPRNANIAMSSVAAAAAAAAAEPAEPASLAASASWPNRNAASPTHAALARASSAACRRNATSGFTPPASITSTSWRIGSHRIAPRAAARSRSDPLVRIFSTGAARRAAPRARSTAGSASPLRSDGRSDRPPLEPPSGHSRPRRWSSSRAEGVRGSRLSVGSAAGASSAVGSKEYSLSRWENSGGFCWWSTRATSREGTPPGGSSCARESPSQATENAKQY
eukprot:1183992-Prorocentrum_minimum.AAC.2